jgi:hypothetical protein
MSSLPGLVAGSEGMRRKGRKNGGGVREKKGKERWNNGLRWDVRVRRRRERREWKKDGDIMG